MNVIEIAYDHCIIEENEKYFITDSVTNYQHNPVENCDDVLLLATKKKKELIEKGYKFTEIDEKTVKEILDLKKRYDRKGCRMPLDTILFKLGKITVLRTG